MSKEPTAAPTIAPTLAPCDTEAGRKSDRLLAQDRSRLSSFVKNLNNGVGFDDMDDDLKAWWLHRY